MGLIIVGDHSGACLQRLIHAAPMGIGAMRHYSMEGSDAV